MIDKILSQFLGDKLKSVKSISIELGDEDQKEKDEMEKEGMAPPMKEKDPEVKGENKMLSPEEGEEVSPEDDPELMDSLMTPREKDIHLEMALAGKKPKGIFEKANQQLVTKKFMKDQK